MTRFARLGLLASVLALAPAGASQALPLQVRLDAGTFRYTDDQTLVEVYLSVGAHTVPFAAAAEGFTADLPVRVRLTPASQGAPAGTERPAVYDQEITFQYQVADTTALTSGQVFVEQMRTAVAPGLYELDVTLAVPGLPEVGLARDLSVPDYAADASTEISTVQLATDIQRAEGASPLAKSGLVVRPNPDAFYGGVGAAVQYYAEVYAPPAEADTYTLVTFVAESDQGAALPGHETRAERAVRPVDVVAGRLPVADLPSGIYYLRLVALDAANEAVAEQSKRFYVINPDVERPTIGPAAMSYEETLFAAMAGEELELNVRHARVLAAGREEEASYALATDDDRRRFLTTFWTSRDPNGVPGTNAARRTFYERLALVNDRYREFGSEPFETDRGRVYLKYGPPTEINRRPFESDMYPHEVWTYDNVPGEGRAMFVFVDRFGSDSYDLVHSDVLGEVSIPNWESALMRGR